MATPKRTRAAKADPQRKRIATLEAELAEARRVATGLDSDCADLILERDNAKAEQAQTEKAFITRDAKRETEIRTLKEENNQLRGMVRAHENELSRRAGYMQAIDDAKPQPPRQVQIEVPHESQPDAGGYVVNGTLEFDNPAYRPGGYGSDRTIRRGWWERP